MSQCWSPRRVYFTMRNKRVHIRPVIATQKTWVLRTLKSWKQSPKVFKVQYVSERRWVKQMVLPIPPGSSARGNLWALAMWRAGLQEACAVKPPNGSESPRCVVTGLPRQSPDRTRPLSPARGMPAPAAPLSGLAAGGEPDPGRHQQELRAQPCPPPAGCRRPQRGARPCPAPPRSPRR